MMEIKNTSLKWSLPRGELLQRALRTDPMSEYLIYLPTTEIAEIPVLVSAHGISRNSWFKQAELLMPICERNGVMLLAPIFNEQKYSDYQRLGRKGRGYRADQFLHRCLLELSTMTGVNTEHIRLFGHSGGAQFVHRYLMAYPHRVESAVISGAGWYTFPDPTIKFPYGIRTSSTLSGISFNPEAYLKVPILVLVGSEDSKQSDDLKNNDRINQQQGLSRIERARNWVAAIREQAKTHGMQSLVSIAEITDASHSLADLANGIQFIDSLFHIGQFGKRHDASTLQ